MLFLPKEIHYKGGGVPGDFVVNSVNSRFQVTSTKYSMINLPENLFKK